MIFFSSCTHCRHLLLMTGKKRHKSYTCSACVPTTSSARDDINESYDSEYKRFKKVNW